MKCLECEIGELKDVVKDYTYKQPDGNNIIFNNLLVRRCSHCMVEEIPLASSKIIDVRLCFEVARAYMKKIS